MRESGDTSGNLSVSTGTNCPLESNSRSEWNTKNAKVAASFDGSCRGSSEGGSPSTAHGRMPPRRGARSASPAIVSAPMSANRRAQSRTVVDFRGSPTLSRRREPFMPRRVRLRPAPALPRTVLVTGGDKVLVCRTGGLQKARATGSISFAGRSPGASGQSSGAARADLEVRIYAGVMHRSVLTLDSNFRSSKGAVHAAQGTAERKRLVHPDVVGGGCRAATNPAALSGRRQPGGVVLGRGRGAAGRDAFHHSQTREAPAWMAATTAGFNWDGFPGSVPVRRCACW